MTVESVHISEVSLYQGLNCACKNCCWGEGAFRGLIFSGVSSERVPLSTSSMNIQTAYYCIYTQILRRKLQEIVLVARNSSAGIAQ